MRSAIDLFNAGKFFESHEAFEEEWRTATGPRRLFLQALIHFAVACHHSQRANTIGAQRQIRKGLVKLQPYLPAYETIDTGRLYSGFLPFVEALEAGTPTGPFPLIHLLE
ncbi:MAG: DUF309 domain-containing protein [Acidobacteria bacterium]|nr:DUF309 domain-containing protein [Acidobacteriota bacterium]